MVDWETESDLDSIHNSCDAFFFWQISFLNSREVIMTKFLVHFRTYCNSYCGFIVSSACKTRKTHLQLDMSVFSQEISRCPSISNHYWSAAKLQTVAQASWVFGSSWNMQRTIAQISEKYDCLKTQPKLQLRQWHNK